MVDKTEILVRFGETLRSQRSKVGLSQEDLAIQAGLDRSYVGGVERGERNVSLINMAKLAKALGISPAELLKGITND
ncbi:helix-turn-helix domain-containing protein [Thermodesulfobacteriota bacterium]